MENVFNGDPTLLVHCLYQMLPLNHKRTTSSLEPPIFYVAKYSAIKRQKASHCSHIFTTSIWNCCVLQSLQFQLFIDNIEFILIAETPRQISGYAVCATGVNVIFWFFFYLALQDKKLLLLIKYLDFFLRTYIPLKNFAIS